MPSATISPDTLEEAVTLTKLGKHIAFIQGKGSDRELPFCTTRERYFRLGFLEFTCKTGGNIYGYANLLIKSRGHDVLDVSWEGDGVSRKNISINCYKPKLEWTKLVSEWGKKNNPEGYFILVR